MGRTPTGAHAPIQGNGTASGCRVIATHSAKAPNTGYLSIEPGDLLVLTHAEVDGYYGGQNLATKETGWFSADAVTMAPSITSESLPQRAPEEVPEPSVEVTAALRNEGG